MSGRTSADKALYLDASQPVESRVGDLLTRMTLEEKIAQLGSSGLDGCLDGESFSPGKLRQKIEKLGIGVLHSSMIQTHPNCTKINLEVINQAQKYLVENTRLPIPAIITAEGIHGHMSDGAAVFPHSIAMASSWDPDLAYRVGSAVAREARAVGISQILSPVLDLCREPRWGRCQETYGEDPYLVSQMGAAFIKGLQGDGPAIDQDHVAATPKHFAAHGSPESGINISPVQTGPRELRTLYLPPFKTAICEAGALSIMPCYSEIDGIPAARNKELLTKILRQEWGFQGYTYSDWESIEMLHTVHHTASTLAEAGKQAIEAGMDLDAPEPRAYGEELLKLVKAGQVAERIIDTAVSRILRVKFLLGLFENPYFADKRRAAEVRDCKEHRELARQVARESIILLRNEGDILPLDEHIGSIAVIGPNADAARTGNYSGVNDRLVTVLDGIRNRVPDAAVSCANGCGIYDLCSDGIAQAVEVAANAEVAILVVGECNEVCEEGTDQTDLDLPGVQMELVKAVAATGTPVVVVLMNGRPLSIPWIAQHVPAVLEVWYPGEEGGNAVADVLFGDHNPCGKLPVSLPRSVGHVPVFYNHKPSARGIYHKPGEPGRPGRDYVFSSPTPLYEFGFGLSYTRFSYSDLTVKPNKIASGGRVKITVTLRNTGKRAGAEVVQLYVNDVVSTVTTPVKVMRRFEKIHLKPGETTHVEFELTPSDLALLDDRMEWVVEPGEFEVMVGGLKEAFVVDL